MIARNKKGELICNNACREIVGQYAWDVADEFTLTLCNSEVKKMEELDSRVDKVNLLLYDHEVPRIYGERATPFYALDGEKYTLTIPQEIALLTPLWQPIVGIIRDNTDTAMFMLKVMLNIYDSGLRKNPEQLGGRSCPRGAEFFCANFFHPERLRPFVTEDFVNLVGKFSESTLNSVLVYLAGFDIEGELSKYYGEKIQYTRFSDASPKTLTLLNEFNCRKTSIGRYKHLDHIVMADTRNCPELIRRFPNARMIWPITDDVLKYVDFMYGVDA